MKYDPCRWYGVIWNMRHEDDMEDDMEWYGTIEPCRWCDIELLGSLSQIARFRIWLEEQQRSDV